MSINGLKTKRENGQHKKRSLLHSVERIFTFNAFSHFMKYCTLVIVTQHKCVSPIIQHEWPKTRKTVANNQQTKRQTAYEKKKEKRTNLRYYPPVEDVWAVECVMKHSIMISCVRRWRFHAWLKSMSTLFKHTIQLAFLEKCLRIKCLFFKLANLLWCCKHHYSSYIFIWVFKTKWRTRMVFFFARALFAS